MRTITAFIVFLCAMILMHVLITAGLNRLGIDVAHLGLRPEVFMWWLTELFIAAIVAAHAYADLK